MKFQDFPYQRPVPEETIAAVNAQLSLFQEAEDAAGQITAISRLNEIFSHVNTMRTLASIRHEISTKDFFYDEEQNFFDRFDPQMQDLLNKHYQTLCQSPYRAELEKYYGVHLFKIAEVSLESFRPEIMDDLAEENQLTTRYTKLLASARIEFDGKILNLSQLDPYIQSIDRSTRRAAVAAKFAFFAEHEAELDEIYSELVAVRDRMAKKLGYENFVQLGYNRMGRTDYGAEQVAQFRSQVKRDLVPITTRLRERQAKRLKLEQLAFHDESLAFLSGNAVPEGDADWILENAKIMYDQLSPESSEFFKVMTERNLLDLVAKEGKAGGGFCTMIPDYKLPFIFSNFNGTAGDVEVLTHEAGHAFQVYRSRDMLVPEYYFPTMEACEIHSMSMEFLTWPWMHRFFGPQTDKFKFNHLAEALLFIPYGVTVDAFQHWVYENPTAAPAERKAQWHELEQVFLPSRDYDDIDFLERGGFWMRQSHIFNAPFYYIDYTLAQTCALQLWKDAQTQPAETWRRYLALCDLGGSKPFTELVEAAGLRNPFTEGCLASVTPAIQKYLDEVDDSAF